MIGFFKGKKRNEERFRHLEDLIFSQNQVIQEQNFRIGSLEVQVKRLEAKVHDDYK